MSDRVSYGLGVDLGTTFTAAAVRHNGHAEVARLGSRRAEIPSLVFVRPDGGVLIGEAAERVRAKFGFACTSAAATAEAITVTATDFADDAVVEVLSMHPPLPHP